MPTTATPTATTADDLTYVAAATGYLVIDGRTVLGWVAPARLNPRVWNAYADLACTVLVGQRSNRRLAAAALRLHHRRDVLAGWPVDQPIPLQLVPRGERQ